MFEELKKEMLEKCYVEVMNNPSQKIEVVMNKIRNETSVDELDKGMKSILQFTLVQSLLMNMNEEETEEVFSNTVKNFLKQLPNLKKSLVISVELNGLEAKVNRVLEVLYSLNLADLCYTSSV